MSDVETSLDKILEETGSGPTRILALLGAVQDYFHYLPEEALKYISLKTGFSPADLWGSATFYDQFRLKPAGEHRIKVCMGTACFIKGSTQVYQAFRETLGLSPGEDTDEKKLFTLEKVSCLGCCMLAPVVQIGQVIYGNVKIQGLPEVLQEYLLRTKESKPNPFLGAKNPSTGTSKELPTILRICECSSCQAAGSTQVKKAFEKEIIRLKLPVSVKSVSCTGLSPQAPLVEMVGQSTHRYLNVHPDQVQEILLRYFRGSSFKKNLQYGILEISQSILRPSHQRPKERTPGKTTEKPLLMSTEHSGVSEPLNLEEYRSIGGLEALEKVKLMAPDQVLAILEESGLRGRGGAGFPSHIKWKLLHEQNSERKILICNGDEGDPGAFMDRMLLESFPFRILEGMMIAVHSLGISEAYLFIRSEYPVAIRRVQEALEIWNQAGLFDDVPFQVVKGAGAFVCGEETALLEAMEGKRGIPRSKPPYPCEKGFLGFPTLINNVETFSLLPWIYREGSQAFIGHGSPSSSGTKTFALAGKILNSGLIEVPLGITLREVIYTHGGGLPEGSQLKALQMGGPSGGCLPENLLDCPVDFDSLQSQGALMGSGGLVVLDQKTCMVDLARYFMEFTTHESCGRCTYCRIGTQTLVEILTKLVTGQGKLENLDELESLCSQIRSRSACGLGKNATNPVLSTLRHFREEYLAHVEGRCPAGHCRELLSFRIGDNCIGCTKCYQSCPVGAITGIPYNRHHIDPDKCTKCGECEKNCPTGAAHGR